MLGQAKRSFTTRPAQRIDAPAPAAPAAQPAAGGQAAPAVAPTPGGDAKPPPAADSAAGAKEGASPAPEAGTKQSPEAEKPAEKITAGEESLRIARIHRAEERHQQQVAKDRRELDEGRATLERERTTHAQDMQRVRAINQLREKPPAAWLPFLRDVFGVQPQVIIDELIGHQQKKPEQLAQEQYQADLARQGARLDEFQKQLQDNAKAQEQARATEALQRFKQEQIVPVLADRAKFELTHRALGETAVDQVYGLMKARYDLVQAGKAGKAVAGLTAERAAAMPLLKAAEAAEIIEAHFRKQRDMLSGTSATPAKPPEPTKTDEPPRAQASGSQAQKPPTATSAAWRNPPKPYTRKLIR